MTHATTTKLGIPSTSHIGNEALRHEVQRLVAEHATYGDFLSYPVLQETGAFNGVDQAYKLVSGMAHVVASVYIYLASNSTRNLLFTATVLGVDGKVKLEGGASVYLIDTAIAYEWVDVEALFYPGLAPAQMMRNLEAAQEPAKVKKAAPATSAKAADTHKRSAKEDFLAACAAAPRPAKDKPKETINSKVLATPVAKKTKATKAPATKLPSADELRKIAKTQNVDTTSVNFRSSTQRAALATKLGLV